MKTERRHELKTNELAETLTELWEFLGRYGQYVVGVVVVAAALLGIRAYIGHSRASSLQQGLATAAQLKFTDDATIRASLDTLRRLTDEVGDANFDLSVLLTRAERAMSVSMSEREFTGKYLDEAEDAYGVMLERFAGERPIAAGAALSGLALVEEHRFALDGDEAHKAKARQYLQRIVDDARLIQTPFATSAVDRLNSLDERFTQIVLAEPPPAAETGATGATAMPATEPPSATAGEPPVADASPVSESALPDDGQSQAPVEEADAATQQPTPESAEDEPTPPDNDVNDNN